MPPKRTNQSVRKAHRSLEKTSRKDPLATYRKKRDFAVTAEPAPEVSHRHAPGGRGEFVVQKHDATRLHYDVRLEIAGAMMSFAVPKGPSYDPNVKRLAVETEDHPMAYNEFEGRIPDGEYGAGDVLIWDRGTYETVPPGREQAMRDKGHLEIRFFGDKLQGRWHFVRTRRSEAKNQWLMFKAQDELADPTKDIVVERPESVVSGKRATRGPQRATASASGKSSKALLAHVGEVEKATLVDGVDDASKYLFEIKYDGYRVVAVKAGTDVRMVSRNGKDWTETFAVLAEAVRALPVREAVFDGEVCAVDADGTPSFHKLQNWFSGGDQGELVYAVFDLLWLDGRDLRALPIEERRQLLEPLVGGGREWTREKGSGTRRRKAGPISISTQIAAEGHTARELVELACARGLEGLIAKRKGSPYISGRTKDWVKLKCGKRQEMAIVGYVPLTRTTDRVGALLLGIVGDDGKLHYAGKVGTGFDTTTRKELGVLLDARRVDASKVVGAPKLKQAHFSEPNYVAEVKFTEWTPDGKIRHPSFVGLRRDKSVMDCVREDAVVVRPHAEKQPKARAKPRPEVHPESNTKSNPKSHNKSHPKAVRGEDPQGLSNPTKVLFPRDGITKRDIHDYLSAIAPVMLPHLAGRPISMQRWPNGIHAPAWYQQRPPERCPEFVRIVDVGDRTHVVVDNLETLQWLGNLAALTIHQWASHLPTLENPDYVIFDLDPGDGTFEHLIEVANALHRLLDELELETVVKTSGKRGLHVLVPLAEKVSFDDVTAFAEKISSAIAKHLPKIATVERMKKSRGGRLYVDYLQNGRGKTIVAPYAIRALDGAPVSTPLSWSEVTPKLDPSAFTLRTVLSRIDREGDLLAPLLRPRNKLPRLR